MNAHSSICSSLAAAGKTVQTSPNETMELSKIIQHVTSAPWCDLSGELVAVMWGKSSRNNLVTTFLDFLDPTWSNGRRLVLYLDWWLGPRLSLLAEISRGGTAVGHLDVGCSGLLSTLELRTYDLKDCLFDFFWMFLMVFECFWWLLNGFGGFERFRWFLYGLFLGPVDCGKMFRTKIQVFGCKVYIIPRAEGRNG